ncbi:hypothetical protein ES288_A10G212800v1 [Gossypium darwinii]|uniref:Uncharacterized protein n=1 Tax=Gossypium darwinii TaxID=34276 RepID=A0A5D2F4R5_GOSDA|nr:hypothetical protein ES288_A10G212800v1 [Gossypium darwinii]
MLPFMRIPSVNFLQNHLPVLLQQSGSLFPLSAPSTSAPHPPRPQPRRNPIHQINSFSLFESFSRNKICPCSLLAICESPSKSLPLLPLHSAQVVCPDQEPENTSSLQSQKLMGSL